jgi:hypothetical protein
VIGPDVEREMRFAGIAGNRYLVTPSMEISTGPLFALRCRDVVRALDAVPTAMQPGWWTAEPPDGLDDTEPLEALTGQPIGGLFDQGAPEGLGSIDSIPEGET